MARNHYFDIMGKLKHFVLFVVWLTVLFGCETKRELQEEKPIATISTGFFVSEEYDKRQEGFDWVGISVGKKNDSIFSISVRSRADLKKPTCTFDGQAWVNGKNQLKSIFENKVILFTFSKNELNVTMENEADKDFLHFFCSGGGTLAGSYKKPKKPMDMAQLNSVDFEKELLLQGIEFHVKSVNKGFQTSLIVEPSNLEIDNSPIEQKLTGYVTGAEVEDMNSDGSPELVIYTKSMDGGMFGQVFGYSVNNGKSMSQVYFPGVKDNPTLNNGYFGYDEFSMVETKLGQRFPLFEFKEGKLAATGKMRQIYYVLKDGEAQRSFAIDQMSEY